MTYEIIYDDIITLMINVLDLVGRSPPESFVGIFSAIKKTGYAKDKNHRVYSRNIP